MHGFEFSRRINEAAPAIGGHRQTVFEECDDPAYQNNQPQRAIGEFEVAVPSTVINKFEQMRSSTGRIFANVIAAYCCG